MTAVTVSATLDTPVIGEVNPLDAVLSWAAWQEAEATGVDLPPISDEHIHDFDLPLAKWQHYGFWGWCTSAPILTPTHYSSVEIRRRPPTGPMAIYTNAREHHSGLGPLKARNTTLQATHYGQIMWHVEATDEQRLIELLTMCTHIGARHRNGFGHVTQWATAPGPVDGWKQRPMPTTTGGRMMRVRAPYWHPTERTHCQ